MTPTMLDRKIPYKGWKETQWLSHRYRSTVLFMLYSYLLPIFSEPITYSKVSDIAKRVTISILDQCTVLMVSGGPAGLCAAAALALEGFSTVLLEAEVIPRYVVVTFLLLLIFCSSW